MFISFDSGIHSKLCAPKKTQLLDISDFAWPVLFEQQQKQLLWELVVICINKVELFLFLLMYIKATRKIFSSVDGVMVLYVFTNWELKIYETYIFRPVIISLKGT